MLNRKIKVCALSPYGIVEILITLMNFSAKEILSFEKHHHHDDCKVTDVFTM